MTAHVFGLTGGIGSGKSTIARRFRERGVPVLDADQVARDVVEPGTDGLREVVEAFGPEVLDRDGSLNRAAVAERVFADDGARARLNAIIHPRVRDVTARRIAELAARGEPLVCYEVPLLIESGLADALRPLVVVAAPESLQVERTMRRDGATEDQARARIRAQMPVAEKVKLADFVIDNVGSVEDATRRADVVLDSICGQLDVDPSRYPYP